MVRRRLDASCGVALWLAGCGFTASADLSIDASGRDGADVVPDALGEGTDAPQAVNACYGPLGIFEVCLSGAPTGTVSLSGTINTTPGMNASCLQAQPIGWAPTQVPACFIIGNTINVSTVTVIGTRPLVLLAHDSITITGTLDVSSQRDVRRGPGVSGVGCRAFARTPANHDKGGGGGAGGTFGTLGGAGGRGEKSEHVGGLPAPLPAVINALRGGCDGQEGGSGRENAGTAGPGGGSTYLVAGTTIQINGAINASGAGADDGGHSSGGSGAGSGGMIVLHAPTINATGILLANGGGGAGGGSKDSDGRFGQNPNPVAPTSVAPGGNGTGSIGGSGYAGGLAATTGTNGAKDKGGGGGAGGAGYIRSNVALGGVVSPPANIVTP